MSEKTGSRVVPTGIDVVMVTFNSAGCLPAVARELDGFLRDYEYRVVVVDNASSDESVSLVRSYGPRWEVIENSSNRGFAAAVNQAMHLVDKSIVLLLNPDVTGISGQVGAVVDVFARRREVVAVAGAMMDSEGRIARSCHTFPTVFTWWDDELSLSERFRNWDWPRRHNMLDWDMQTPRDVEDACGGFLFLRTSALRQLGALDEQFFLYWEETDWLLRAARLGYRTHFTPAVAAIHEGQRSSGCERRRMSEHRVRSGYLYMRKHHGRAAELLARSGFLCIEAAKIVKHSLEPVRISRLQRLREDARQILLHLGALRVDPPR